MPSVRKKFVRFEKRTWRFVTFSCYKRLPLLSNPKIADLFAEHLAACRAVCGFKLRAWVVMPEHVHLMILPYEEEWPVTRILSALKQSVAQRVISRWRTLDAAVLSDLQTSDGRTRFWQAGGGFDRVVRSEDARAKEVDYIHWNPVRRGLVKIPTDWAWSSARAFVGMSDGGIPIDR